MTTDDILGVQLKYTIPDETSRRDDGTRKEIEVTAKNEKSVHERYFSTSNRSPAVLGFPNGVKPIKVRVRSKCEITQFG
jgi:hypothetical protein